jgi:hypothetical protein
MNNNSRVLYNKPCKETYQSRRVNNGQKLSPANFGMNIVNQPTFTGSSTVERDKMASLRLLTTFDLRTALSSKNTITHAIKVENESTLHRQKDSQILHTINTVFIQESII